MSNNLKLYEVSCFGNHKLHIYAKDSGQAKRAYCKQRGLTFADPWCGASTLSARALKPAEVEALEAQAPIEQFIKGMLEICAQVYDTRPKEATT